MIPVAQPAIGEEEIAAVVRVLRSGGIAQGPEVAAFEDEFSSLTGGRTAVAVNSGTSALHLGLLAAGIGPGDEVIVPSFSFAATANAVVLAGADPVFVDIRPDTFCLSPEAVDAAITGRTAAIMAVHLYGHPAAMDALGRIARVHGLLLVEDAAQAHGAALGGQPVGAMGDVAAFSFYPTKNMTTGEGGMIVTGDAETARRARLLRNPGMEQRYRNEIVGFNARMTDIAAAIGRVQLRSLPMWTARRRANAAVLDEGLDSVVGVKTPRTAADVEHVYHQYTIRVPEDRDAFVERLRGAGVGAAVYYPTPIHALPSFGLDLDLPETTRAAREVLSLPVHPQLDQDALQTVVEAVTREVRA
jgi:perosamine synthetase